MQGWPNGQTRSATRLVVQMPVRRVATEVPVGFLLLVADRKSTQTWYLALLHKIPGEPGEIV